MRTLPFTPWRRLVSLTNRVWNTLDIPLRLPILTTRRLMVLVAVVAISIGVAKAIPRAIAYRDRAATHAQLESHFRDKTRERLRTVRAAQTEFDQFRRDSLGPDPLTEEYLGSRLNFEVLDAKYLEETADYHANLAATYRRAIWFAWGFVARDPPPPLDPLRRSSNGDASRLPGYFRYEGGVAVTFAPDGSTVAVGCRDNTIKLMEPFSGRVRMTLRMPDSRNQVAASDIAFSPDGAMIAGANDQIVRIWETATGRVRRAWSSVDKPTTGPPSSSTIIALSFSPDGHAIAVALCELAGKPGSESYSVRVLDATTCESRWVYRGGGGCPHSLAFSSDGKTLACDDGGAILLDARTGALKTALEPAIGKVMSVAFSPDGRTLAGGGSDAMNLVNLFGRGQITVWDVPTGTISQTLEGLTARVQTVAFSPDGKMVAAGGNGPQKDGWDKFFGPRRFQGVSEVRLWDVATGNLIWTREGECNAAYSLDFSPDGTFLAFCDDYHIYLIDVKTGNLKRILMNTQIIYHMSEPSSEGNSGLPAMMGGSPPWAEPR